MQSLNSAVRRRLALTATAMTVVGMLPINLLPMLVESWIGSFGLGPSEAGRVAGTELGTMAIASIVLSFRIHRLRRRPLALGAGLGAALLSAACAGLEDPAWLPLLRAAAGVCEGILLGAVAALISAYAEPERLYAWVAIAGSFVAITMWAVVPPLVERLGAGAAFGTMSLVAGLALPLFFWIPDPSPRAESAVFAAEARREAARAGRSGLGPSGFVLVVAGLCVAAGQGAVWSFSGRIAEELGLSTAGVGLTFGSATLAGTLGAGLAAWVGLERGRLGPLSVGFFGILLAIGLITAHPWAPLFVTGQILFALFYFFVSPYVMGLAAEIDRNGRVATALSGALLVGAGLGPALGGFIVEHGSIPALGTVGAALTLIPGGLLMLDPPIRRCVLSGAGPEAAASSGRSMVAE